MRTNCKCEVGQVVGRFNKLGFHLWACLNRAHDQPSAADPEDNFGHMSLSSTRIASTLTEPFSQFRIPLYPQSNRMSTIALKIEFGGGLELLFGNQRSHRIDIPSKVATDNDTTVKDLEAKEAKAADVSYLVHHMRDHMLKERAELFMENGTV